MPDLNLIDEGGFDDVPEAPEAPAAPAAKKSVKKSSGGGGAGKILLIVVLLCIVGAGVYYLNMKGIIKLWGKRSRQVVQVQDDQFPPVAADQSAQVQNPTDTNAVALLETAPVEEKVEAGKQPEAVMESEAIKEPKTKSSEKSRVVKKSAPASKTEQPAAGEETMVETESSSKLSEMKGEFTIQVIAYREKSRAEETSKNLEFSGYPSFVEKIPMKGGDWYTVRIGHYSSRDEAKKAVQSFAEQLQSSYVIDKVRYK